MGEYQGVAYRPGQSLEAGRGIVVRYILRRLLATVPLVLGIATLIFLLINLAPGDPVRMFAQPGVSPEALAQLRQNLGLNEPLHIRYFNWLGSLVRGDLGTSFQMSRPVLEIIKELLPNTLLLSGCALALAFGVGIVVGTYQAFRQYSVADSVLSVVLLFFYSMPSFWLALMLVLTLSLFARNVWEWPIWFPSTGIMSVDAVSMGPVEYFLDRARHLVLPTLSLALVLTAGIARYMRGSMLEVIRQDYVRTARAKGLSEFVVVFKHALRNALIPIITLVGLYIPYLISGTLFVELVFAWPGMGRALVNAVFTRDYPLIVGGALFFSTMVVLANLLADILYAIVDPRVRYD